MNTVDNHELADRLGRRRARMFPIFAFLFITQQATFFARPGPADMMRTVDHVLIGGWLLLTMVLVAALWTGGFWFHGKEVRALMNDDVARANRADALSLGFLAMMVMALVLYFIAMIEPVTIKETLHGIISAGLVAALLRFGILERRAFRAD